jgi:hypothetical protein
VLLHLGYISIFKPCQLATLCVTLQEDVYVGYWKHGRYCKSLAQKCYALLGQYVDEANLARVRFFNIY